MMRTSIIDATERCSLSAAALNMDLMPADVRIDRVLSLGCFMLHRAMPDNVLRFA